MSQSILTVNNTDIDLAKISEHYTILGASLDPLSEEISLLTNDLNDIATKAGVQSEEYITATRELTKKTLIKDTLQKVIEIADEYMQSLELVEDELLADEAKEELERIEPELRKTIIKLDSLLIEPLPYDDESVIIEFRPGVGGVEASLFAEELFRAYSRFLNTTEFKAEVASIEYDNESGIKEAVLIINQKGAFGALRFESGVHRVQRVPVTESGSRIHTSTASIAILPKFEAKDIKIDQSDLRIDVYRSSGPGGQSVNTTDSAVRITHLPTGITVSCQNGKSQHKNKDMALSILQSKLVEIELEKKQSATNEFRSDSIGDGDRSAKIRTFNFPQGRITDHRINTSWFNISAAMEGDLEEIVTTVSIEMRKKDK